MINRRILLALAAAISLAGAHAQVNQPDAAGYLARGVRMYHDENYNGCIDQLTQMRHLSPDASQAEDATYYLAMATMGLGDDEALPLLRLYLEQYPQSPRRQDVQTSIGDFYFTRYAYGDAIRAYTQADPECLDADRAEDYYYRLAYSYLMLAEYDQAGPLFARLTGTEKYGEAAKFYQAYIAYCKQDYRQALTLFKQVDTSTEPGNTADYYIAQIYFVYGDYNQALAAARRMIAANPVPEFTTESRRIAGESLYNLGNTADAIPYLWQYLAEAENPQPSAYYILGMQEYDNKDYKAAIKLFQKAVGTNDAMAQNAYFYLGQCYLNTGNTTAALMAFENAYRMNYDSKVQETAFYNYAVARSEGGKAPFSSSVSVFEDFLRQYPNSRYADDIRSYLVTGYMTDDDYEGALQAINRIPNPSEEITLAKQRVLFVLGTRDYTNDNTALALSRFTEAKAIEPGNQEIANQAELWSGDCYYRTEEWEKAAKCYLNFLDSCTVTDPNRQLAYYNLGYVRYQQHQYANSLLDFQRAVDTSGSLSVKQLADARDRMGDCYAAQGDFAAAATQYQTAYDLSPASGDYALYRLAQMRGYQGNYAQELQLLDQMMDRFPSSGLYPAALLTKAETYTATGQNSKAIAAYNQLVRDYPQSSYGRNGMLQLAITYADAGDEARAVETYRKVIYTYPSSDEARLAADDLKRIYARQGNLNEYVTFINSIPNAPRLEPGEVEQLAFEAAEEWYLDDKGTDRLMEFLADYPGGANVATAMYYIAEDAEDRGDYETAYSYATRVILSTPDSEVAEEALAIKGNCELQQGKGEIALATYRQLEEKASSPMMLHQARMQILRVARDLGRNTEVVSVADKLLASSAAGGDDQREIHFTRALALNNLGRYDEAYTEWTELMDDLNDPYGAKAAFYMANSQYDRNLGTRAEKTVTRLVDSDSSQDYWRARGVILLSDILRRGGNTFEADQYLRAMRNNYTDPATQAEIQQMVDERLK